MCFSTTSKNSVLFATKSGISMHADMHMPSTKPEMISRRAWYGNPEVVPTVLLRMVRYNKVIDIWANVTEKIATDDEGTRGRGRPDVSRRS